MPLLATLLLGAVFLPPGAPQAKLDINTATAEQLASLPGMGREYARRVIAGRPYRAKNQLSTRGIVPDDEYRRIADRIVARRVPEGVSGPPQK